MRKQSTPPGRPFTKGDARAGRRKGALNRATREAKALCNAIVDDPKYVKKLHQRMIRGRAAPAVECMVWYYAKGKPKERVELGADKSLAQLIAEAGMGSGEEENDDGGVTARKYHRAG